MADPLARDALVRPLRKAITSGVVALFNDRSRGEQPVTRRLDGLFGPGAVAWRVHGDVTSMMVGRRRQPLAADAAPRRSWPGVWDLLQLPSRDMHGRLRRTARFIALTTYGGREEAEAILARVRGIHDQVSGTLTNGTPLTGPTTRRCSPGCM